MGITRHVLLIFPSTGQAQDLDNTVTVSLEQCEHWQAAAGIQAGKAGQ